MASDSWKSLVARLTAWANPVTKVDMGNLDLAMAQKRVASDETARDMLAALLSTMAQVEGLHEKSGTAVRAARSYSGYAQCEGEAIYYARKLMAQMVLERDELRNETLAYGRLVQKLNRTAVGGERDELTKHNVATKKALDDKRADHDVAMATAKAQLKSAEDELLHCYDTELVIDVVERLELQESKLEQAVSIRKQLEVDLKAFEEYVASLG
jgi:hypothetical protein